MRSENVIGKTMNKETVEQYYSPGDLMERFTQILKRSGKDINSITVEDLSPIDEFHLRGHEGTEELLSHLPLNENSKILDVGCGIGGPCRLIASKYRSQVTGVDLSAEFIKTAVELTRLTGLNNNLNFQKADATSLPFDNRKFDFVITIHAQMNIENKEKLIKEISRVLKPGGEFAFYDLFKEGTEPIHYPVPWAEDESISFLAQWDKYKEILEANELKKSYEKDTTPEVIEWFKAMVERSSKTGEFPVNMRIVMGDDAKTKMMNTRRNIEEGRIKAIQAIFTRT